jgi:hypothetical protein
MSARLLPFPSLSFPAEQAAGTLRPSDVIEAVRAILEGGALPAATLQKIAAALVELRLVTRLPNLYALFPDPAHALGIHRPICRIVCGVKEEELLHIGDALFATITAACRETAPDLGDKFDAEVWADVLTEILKPQCPAAGAACEIHDIATLRLTRLARRGAFVGASFAADEGDGDGDDAA